MIAALGYFAVTGAGIALLLAGQMWWAAAVLLIGMVGMNALSRR